MTRLGIITGMKFEADIVIAELAKPGAPDNIAVACDGPGFLAAKQCAHRLLDEGCTALLSFGVAGGLLEGLKAGTLLIASQVINWDEAIDADRAWMAKLQLGIGGQTLRKETGNIAHSDPPAATPADKRTLHIHTKALGVDMESFAIAKAAQARKVPFITLRVVADGAGRMLPVSALAALDEVGNVSAKKALASLALHPWEIGEMARLAYQNAAATKTLRNLALLGVPRLFFV